jgi:hypothetical protein
VVVAPGAAVHLGGTDVPLGIAVIGAAGTDLALVDMLSDA